MGSPDSRNKKSAKSKIKADKTIQCGEDVKDTEVGGRKRSGSKGSTAAENKGRTGGSKQSMDSDTVSQLSKQVCGFYNGEFLQVTFW